MEGQREGTGTREKVIFFFKKRKQDDNRLTMRAELRAVGQKRPTDETGEEWEKKETGHWEGDRKAFPTELTVEFETLMLEKCK